MYFKTATLDDLGAAFHHIEQLCFTTHTIENARLMDSNTIYNL